MPDFRVLLERAGCSDVRTYVQSGNVVLKSRHRTPTAVSKAVGGLMRERFDVDQPVVVRTPEQVSSLIEVNPFADAALERPKLLHVVFLTAEPAADAIERMHTDEVTRDVVRIIGPDMFVDFGESVQASKLSPAYFSRRLVVEGTARNWRTVLALAEMTGVAAG